MCVQRCPRLCLCAVPPVLEDASRCPLVALHEVLFQGVDATLEAEDVFVGELLKRRPAAFVLVPSSDEVFHHLVASRLGERPASHCR